jgi:hypothetical protein
MAVLFVVLLSPPAWAIPVQVRFVVSFGGAALDVGYSSVQLIGYQPNCTLDSPAYIPVPNQPFLEPGESFATPDLVMGDFTPGEMEGGHFCLIFQLNGTRAPYAQSTQVRLSLNYLMALSEAGHPPSIIQIVDRPEVAWQPSPMHPRRNVPQFHFGELQEGTFLTPDRVQLALPITGIVPPINTRMVVDLLFGF